MDHNLFLMYCEPNDKVYIYKWAMNPNLCIVTPKDKAYIDGPLYT